MPAKKYVPHVEPVEAVKYQGIGTQRAAITRWVLGGEYIEPTDGTMDRIPFFIPLPDGGQLEVNSSWWVVRRDVGFVCIPSEDFCKHWKAAG